MRIAVTGLSRAPHNIACNLRESIRNRPMKTGPFPRNDQQLFKKFRYESNGSGSGGRRSAMVNIPFSKKYENAFEIQIRIKGVKILKIEKRSRGCGEKRFYVVGGKPRPKPFLHGSSCHRTHFSVTNPPTFLRRPEVE